MYLRPRSNALTLALQIGHSGLVHVWPFPDGKQVLTGGGGKSARLWDAASARKSASQGLTDADRVRDLFAGRRARC